MRRAHVAALACVFGALGCTMRPTRTRRCRQRGTAASAPASAAAVFRRTPERRRRRRDPGADGRAGSRRAGSLVDVVSTPSSIRRTAPTSSTRPASRRPSRRPATRPSSSRRSWRRKGMDIYTGRISLGDRPTGDYTLTVTRDSSGGIRGVAAPVNFPIDAGPVLSVTSPKRAARLQAAADHRGRRRSGTVRALDGPHAKVANYRRHAHAGRGSRQPCLSRHDRLPIDAAEIRRRCSASSC